MANNFDKFTCFFSQQQLQMLQKHLLLYISVFLLLFTNCKEDKGIKKPLPATIKTSLNIDYAKGFLHTPLGTGLGIRFRHKMS